MSSRATPENSPETRFDPDCLFRPDGPIDPAFMLDAMQLLMRAMPITTPEPETARRRHRNAAAVGLMAAHPRDPIEVMLSVQAVSAFHAAATCWRNAADTSISEQQRLRFISAAGSAARSFDTMLRAIERRQAKPVAKPTEAPEPKVWPKDKVSGIVDDVAQRIREHDLQPAPPPADPPPSPVTWSPEAIAHARKLQEEHRVKTENAGLDIANTEGILPDGGMIVPENPTPQQEAYLDRRLGLMYKREYQENLRKGIKQIPKIRPIRPGDRIP